jgi:hypothetical protein
MSDKKPRGVVGRLLQKIKGGKTPTPPPTPKGPKDPVRSMTLFTRLRDAGLVAERDSLSLNGTLPARRKAIVTELEADRYEQAEKLLEALNVDYEKERMEKRATEQLKLEFGGIKQRAVAAANTKSTSPVIADAIRKANKVEQAITDNIKAKEVILAARLLASYDQAVKTVAQLEELDIESFKVEWLKVDTELGNLTAPVIGPDVTKVRNDEVTPAKNKADGGDAFAGLQLLATALLSCDRVAKLQQAYDKALLDAQNLLNARKTEILPLDAEQIQKDLIDAAKDKAKLGQRQAALDLLSQVAARCGTAKTDRDIAPSWKADLEQKMTALLSHAQKAALAKEIAALNVRFERAKANQALALTKAGNALYSEIYWECQRLTELATAHGNYVQLRDSDVKPKVQALRTDEPTSAVTPLEAEIKAAEDALARAERKADKHQYEMAKEALAQLKTQCATVAQLKRDQAAYAVLHKEVAELLAPLPEAKGTPFEAPFAALRTRLTQAEQQAVTQRQFVQATQALTTLKADVQSALSMSNGTKEAETAITQAKPAGDSAEALRTSLDKVRQLLETLKLHPGHPGAETQIEQMTTLLQQAEEALKD